MLLMFFPERGFGEGLGPTKAVGSEDYGVVQADAKPVLTRLSVHTRLQYDTGTSSS